MRISFFVILAASVAGLAGPLGCVVHTHPEPTRAEVHEERREEHRERREERHEEHEHRD